MDLPRDFPNVLFFLALTLWLSLPRRPSSAINSKSFSRDAG
jgi:hypothetical protein